MDDHLHPDLACAEVSFAVIDAFHGAGAASILLKHLVGIARQKGIQLFEADVLGENRAMLTVFQHSDLPIRKSSEAEVVHLELNLPPK